MMMVTKCAINGDDGDNDDDHSCVVMTIVVGLLHDNGHYRCHKGERPPLEAFIGSFLLHSLAPQRPKFLTFMSKVIRKVLEVFTEIQGQYNNK